jgi:hypothetical protein
VPDFLDVNISGMDKIVDKLKRLPDAVGDAGVEAASKYLLNVLVNKEIPSQKKVTRLQAYGSTFSSDKQRRYFFWALRQGIITVPYQRRGRSSGVQSAWELHGSGKEIKITNGDEAAKWLYSEMQANLNRMVGWMRVSQIIDKYTKQIVGAFDRSVNKALRKLGLK